MEQMRIARMIITRRQNAIKSASLFSAIDLKQQLSENDGRRRKRARQAKVQITTTNETPSKLWCARMVCVYEWNVSFRMFNQINFIVSFLYVHVEENAVNFIHFPSKSGTVWLRCKKQGTCRTYRSPAHILRLWIEWQPKERKRRRERESQWGKNVRINLLGYWMCTIASNLHFRLYLIGSFRTDLRFTWKCAIC